MVPKLDLSRRLPGRALSAGDERGLRLLAVGIGGLALLAIAWHACGGGLVLLLPAIAAGVGLTYLSGLPLLLEERIAYGAVIGCMAASLVSFLLALAFGLSLATVLAGLAAALAAGAAGFWSGRDGIRAELASVLERGAGQWPLWALLLVCWAYGLHLLGQSFVATPSGGLDAGNPGVFGDWAAHLTFASSFAYGGNFPPQYPVDPGHRMAYPFMVDFLAAELVPLGVRLTSALVQTSGLLLLALPAVIYLAGVRLTGSRLGSALGAVVFLTAGGFGFLDLVQPLQQQGLGILGRLPHLYTQVFDQNIQMLTPVLAYLVPQRSVLFGLTVALIAAALLWTASHEAGGRRTFLFTGVLVGLTPLFHVHGYGTALALGALWALYERRRLWLWFLVPAAVLGVPVVVWMLQGGGGALRWLPGWYANLAPYHDGGIVFWLKNLGVFVPLLLAAQLWPGLLANGFQRFLAPIWLWFLVPNFVVLQPWEWDNTKYFVFFLLFGSLLIGAALVELGRRGPLAVAAAGLFVLLTLSGGLDLARTANLELSGAGFLDRPGIEAAGWVRQNTDPHSVVLVAANHDEPVAMLSGRPLVIGYGGWLWTYGLSDWSAKTADAIRMLRGEPATPELLRQYGVVYVVIGPQELSSQWGANAVYWRSHGTALYQRDGYTVYRVDQLWR